MRNGGAEEMLLLSSTSRTLLSHCLLFEVKPPGVTKDMVGRWQRKDGKLDCTTLDYVPFCGVSLEEKCGRTYYVQSGIGPDLRCQRHVTSDVNVFTVFQEFYLYSGNSAGFAG